jgi:hypothetical protein
MRVGIVPTKAGYSAVVLPKTVTESGWELEVPAVALSPDLLLQLKAQITQDLAEYCEEMSTWMGQFWISLLWAAWGLLALGVSSMWKFGLRTALLYGWIRVLFFGDGVWALSKYLCHLKGLRRAQWLRKHLAGGDNWWVMSRRLDFPVREHLPRHASETDVIEYAQEWFPEVDVYYSRMQEKQAPWVFRYIPLGFLGFIKRLAIGPKIVLPRMVYELGLLQVTEDVRAF